MHTLQRFIRKIRHPRVTYSRVYHHIFENRDSLEAIVHRKLSPTSSLRQRFHWSRHLLTMFRTQSWPGEYLSPAVASHVTRQFRLAHLAVLITHLRPLQRRILTFLYRPGGRLMQRSMAAALS